MVPLREMIKSECTSFIKGSYRWVSTTLYQDIHTQGYRTLIQFLLMIESI
jgi:hypothetical protein